MKPLTMEETFFVTYLGIFLISLPLGFLTYWIFEKDNNKNKEE